MGTVRCQPAMYEPLTYLPTRYEPGSWTTLLQRGRGNYRIAQDALNRYELFTDNTTPVDVSGTPDTTSTSSSYTYALAANQTHYVVELKRNKYNVVSNSDTPKETRFEIDVGGDQVTNPPSAPTNVTLTDLGGGVVQVEAEYNWTEDGTTNRADQWNVYATVGSDPNPAVDAAATTVAMGYLSAQASPLKTTISGYTDGQVVYVIVTTYRTSDTTQSTNTTASTITVEVDGAANVSITAGDGLMGEQHAQG